MDDNEQRKIDDKEIIVRGILGITKSILELFFESEKRSGGSKIEHIEIVEEKHLAIITYSDLGVVERVLKNGPTFKIGSQQVTVECPPKPEPRAVIVEGIPKNTPLQLLELFFESRRKSSGGDIEQIQYEEGSGKAVITFQNVEVAQRVLSRKNLSISDMQLRISPVTSSMKAGGSVANTVTVVPDPRVIYVAGIPADMDEEKLQLILESKKHGNLGIESVALNRDSGSAVITCETKEDAEQILEKGTLQVGGIELSFSSGKDLRDDLTRPSSPEKKANHKQQDYCTIMITNLPKISENYLKTAIEKDTGAQLSCLTMYPKKLKVRVKLEQIKGKITKLLVNNIINQDNILNNGNC